MIINLSNNFSITTLKPEDTPRVHIKVDINCLQYKQLTAECSDRILRITMHNRLQNHFVVNPLRYISLNLRAEDYNNSNDDHEDSCGEQEDNKQYSNIVRVRAWQKNHIQYLHYKNTHNCIINMIEELYSTARAKLLLVLIRT